MHINNSKNLMKASRKAAHTNTEKGLGSRKEGDKKLEVCGNWKNKFKQVTKMPNGLKTIMSVLSDE